MIASLDFMFHAVLIPHGLINLGEDGGDKLQKQGINTIDEFAFLAF